MPPWIVESCSPAQTQALGEALGRVLGPATVILLSGDLGAGKTCFTQGLARGLGVPADEPVVSPSYTLMNPYRGRLDLYHFDLYRLTSPEDLIDLGVDEYLCGNGVTVVEWGDRFPGLVLDGLRIHIDHGQEDERRRITLCAADESQEAVLDALRRQWPGTGAIE